MQKFSLKQSIELIYNESEHRALTVQEITNNLSLHGREVLLILVALPFCQPLQIPGLSTPFGLIVVILGWQIALQNPIYIPKKLKIKKIPSRVIRNICKTTLKLLDLLKYFMKPRLLWLSTNRFFLFIHGLMISMLGLFLALPLPIPLTNILAAIPLVAFGFGLALQDGLWILFAYVLTVLPILSIVGIINLFR